MHLGRLRAHTKHASASSATMCGERQPIGDGLRHSIRHLAANCNTLYTVIIILLLLLLSLMRPHRRGAQMFRKVHVPLLGLVENMSCFTCPKCGHSEAIFGEGGGAATAADLGMELLGQV